jgi:hypothetical protein
MDQKKYVGSAVRTALAAVGGALIAKGVPADWVMPLVDQGAALLTGFLVWGGVQAWSIAEKKAKDEFKKRF